MPEEQSSVEARIERLDKRVDLFLWTNSALACVVLVSIALSLTALWGENREANTLSKLNYDVTRQFNKLRVEAGIADARSQAAKGLLREAGVLEQYQAILDVESRYALEAQRANGDRELTRDAARRELCGQLESELGRRCE